MGGYNKQRLERLLDDMESIIHAGDQVLTTLKDLKNELVTSELSMEEREVLQLSYRQMGRRFRRTQVAGMLGISPTAIAKAEDNGRLPPPDKTEDSRGRERPIGYTLVQILHMRETFDKCVHKPDGADTMILGFLNLKGGSQKTTLALLSAQHYALKGYRVLLVDTDPQGTLSFLMGHHPDIDVAYEDTVAPFLLEDEEALVAVGHPAGAHKSLRYAIKQTHWKNIDLIPACMENLRIDLELQGKVAIDRRIAEQAGLVYDQAGTIEILRGGIQEVADDYDLVIFDGTPSLNLSTLNVLTACDLVVVPTPSQMVDYASTLQFTNLIALSLENYLDKDYYPNYPDIAYLITKVSPGQFSDWMVSVIGKTMGAVDGYLLDSVVHLSEEIGKQGASIQTIYEAEPKDSNNPKGLKRAVSRYDTVYDEIFEKHIKPFWGIDEIAEDMPLSEATRPSVVEAALREKGVI